MLTARERYEAAYERLHGAGHATVVEFNGRNDPRFAIVIDGKHVGSNLREVTLDNMTRFKRGVSLPIKAGAVSYV